jgi:hypothetical protein
VTAVIVGIRIPRAVTAGGRRARGQKTAGSPLGSIVRAVARYFARLPDPVHVASWVDDLIFIMSTPEHGECAGFVGGCPVCTEYHGRALKVQELWHASILQDIGRGAPYLAHPRRVRRSSNGSSIAHQTLIKRSNAHQTLIYRSAGLFVALLLSALPIHLPRALIYRSSIAHLRGHRLVGSLPYSALTAFGRALCR